MKTRTTFSGLAVALETNVFIDNLIFIQTKADSMALSKIHETLFILYKCKGNIERLHAALEEYRQKGAAYELHHFSHNLAYYFIMEVVSFLDEYRNFFNAGKVEQEYKERVHIMRKVLKPLIDMFEKWKDLKTFRSQVIAHGLRDKKNGNFIIPHLENFDIPRSAFEYQLIKDLIIQGYDVIQQEFETEINEAVHYVYKGRDIRRDEKQFDEINIELSNMLDKMNGVCHLNRKTYNIRITGYNFNKDL